MGGGGHAEERKRAYRAPPENVILCVSSDLTEEMAQFKQDPYRPCRGRSVELVARNITKGYADKSSAI